MAWPILPGEGERKDGGKVEGQAGGNEEEWEEAGRLAAGKGGEREVEGESAAKGEREARDGEGEDELSDAVGCLLDDPGRHQLLAGE